MNDLASWSLNLGRWSGIPIRLHVFFLLFAVCSFYLCADGARGSRDVGAPNGSSFSALPDQPAIVAEPGGGLSRGRVEMPLTVACATALAILLGSVLLHELAHAAVALRMGGRVDQLVLGPLGGMTPVDAPPEPQPALLVALAGPLANLLIAVAVVPLVVFVAGTNPLGLLNPLVPRNLIEGTVPEIILKMTFWLNWSLALISFLPAYPFDGGRVLRSLLWPIVGYRTAVLAVTRTAKVVAVGICVCAWIMRDAYTGALIPLWVPLLLIAIFLFFSANQELVRFAREGRDDNLFQHEYSSDASLQQRIDHHVMSDHVGMLKRWREERRQTKERERRRREVAEEARVDTILARLHETGIQNLPAEDRALLERVSARYRNRLH